MIDLAVPIAATGSVVSQGYLPYFFFFRSTFQMWSFTHLRVLSAAPFAHVHSFFEFSRFAPSAPPFSFK